MANGTMHYDIRRTFQHFYFYSIFSVAFQYRETLNSPGGVSSLHKKFENFEKIKINSQNFDIKLSFEGGKVVASYL